MYLSLFYTDTLHQPVKNVNRLFCWLLHPAMVLRPTRANDGIPSYATQHLRHASDVGTSPWLFDLRQLYDSLYYSSLLYK
jgi:hypothetical protein